MNNLLSPEEEEHQQFIADYEDCTPRYKHCANIPFAIPQLPLEIIDKIFLGKNVGNTDAVYKQDYYLQGLVAFYRHPEVRIIHGSTPLHLMELNLLSRSIQSLYN